MEVVLVSARRAAFGRASAAAFAVMLALVGATLACAAVLGAPAVAHAAGGGNAWAVPAEPPTQRNYLQRSYTKIRPGSMLKGDTGAPIPVPPDLRSAAGKRRDQDVMKHFARLAELDVIDDTASKRKDVSLQENVEEVRRKEMERFHAIMQELRSVSWRTWLGELP